MRSNLLRRMNSRLVLLGTGASTCVPNLGCLLGIRGESACVVCREAQANPLSKNRRNNPSLLIQRHYKDPQQAHAVLIDCGKTFRAAVERFFPTLGVQVLDAVILTHDHADAVLGLDDLRDLQRFHKFVDETTQEVRWQAHSRMQVFCSDQTFVRMKAAFPYLMTSEDPSPPAAAPTASSTKPASESLPSSKSTDASPEAHAAHLRPHTASTTLPNHVTPAPHEAASAANPKEPQRFTSQLEWTIVAELDDERRGLDPEFEAAGIKIQPLRLYHGGTYICLGFVFGLEGSRIAYLSDVKVIPQPTLDYLKSITIDVLVLDALFVDRKHSTHFNLHEALEAIEELKPHRTILTGMTHEFNYYTKNAELQQLKNKSGEPIDVCMGYDGMEIPVNL